MWIEFNPNPSHKRTDDCTIRAICKAVGLDWETAYRKLADCGLWHHDMMQMTAVPGTIRILAAMMMVTTVDHMPGDVTAWEDIQAVDIPEMIIWCQNCVN